MTENNIKNYLAESIYECLCIYNENTIIGFIIISVIEDEAEIIDLAISKQYQRQGAAQKLFEYALEILILKNTMKIFLEVNENNKEAISFYKKNNFYLITKRENYYNIDGQKQNALILSREVQNK